MKKWIIALAVCIVIALCCFLRPSTPQEDPTQPAESTTASTITEPSTAPVLTGWQEVDGQRCFYLEDGTPASGWMDIDGSRYYLAENGSPLTGWLELEEKKYYFGEDGVMCTGWAELDGCRYYLGEDGSIVTGWLELEEKKYYFGEDGIMCTGWLTVGENRYYFQEDGSAATSKTVIDGQDCYFSPGGIYVLLVNPWIPVPDDYFANLLPIENEQLVEVSCYQALDQMLSDCEDAGFLPFVCSAYRSQAEQEGLFQNKVEYYLDQDYEEDEARQLAATIVAVPGTSEHQLGLAFDIIAENFPYLNDDQAYTPTQQWLMEHCAEYGFILRYPYDTTDTTGIIYEPWHYRYVGVEVATEIQELGVTLEEYLGFTHE